MHYCDQCKFALFPRDALHNLEEWAQALEPVP